MKHWFLDVFDGFGVGEVDDTWPRSCFTPRFEGSGSERGLCEVWLGTSDDWIGTTDQPSKQQGDWAVDFHRFQPWLATKWPFFLHFSLNLQAKSYLSRGRFTLGGLFVPEENGQILRVQSGNRSSSAHFPMRCPLLPL